MDAGGGRPVGRVGRFFRSPVGWPLYGLVALPCLVTLESASLPMGRVFNALGSAFVLLACGVVWGIRLVVAAVLRHRTPVAERGPFRWRRWLGPPAIVAVTAALLGADVPLRVRFGLKARRTIADRGALRAPLAVLETNHSSASTDRGSRGPTTPSELG